MKVKEEGHIFLLQFSSILLILDLSFYHARRPSPILSPEKKEIKEKEETINYLFKGKKYSFNMYSSVIVPKHLYRDIR